MTRKPLWPYSMNRSGRKKEVARADILWVSRAMVRTQDAVRSREATEGLRARNNMVG